MRGALVVVLLLAQPARADTTCEQEAAELRAHLENEQRLARRWNTIWGLSLGAVAVGQFAVAYANPVPELRDGLYVGAGKASLGALVRLVLPLRLGVPTPAADPCTDVASLRKAVRAAARLERNNFYLNHLGGILVNTAGASILWYRGSPTQALLSVATGYPVTLLLNYTAPRNSWHLDRERSWTIAVMPHDDAWVVSVGGTL